ncbi:C-X-C chemokine receptor type 3-2 [Poecilia latipinna]|uniref:Chemokine (C-X-C motif) receptor 3, tandem duplicate 2 n=3 Tax=Poecilia TaxID=8080 RepID=A0A087YQZ0_POEFO|nr:PREDICTED: C-X-C chemokine receptor type 3-like [Poecilia mexicana]XP_014908330.1 PREDICTED: C-X-C chemokine receptor type 3-like [Poecilia latipinna]XP_016527810.1 PREDICTED: C-X-C chemokine receptor type 3-like [Poecilia formosa]
MDPTATTTDYYDGSDDDYDNNPGTEEVIATPCNQESIYGFARNYSPIVYCLVFVLAVVGNVLVLCVIRRYRNSQSGGACAFSLTDTFLLHLAISDLLLAFTLPLFAVQWANQWVFGTAVCKISGALFSLNRYSGILFLACISFDRYLAIVHAVRSGWKRNTCHAQLACATIWVVCLGLSGVDIAFKQVVPVGHNDDERMQVCQIWFTANSDQWQVSLQLVSLSLGFGLPLLVMLYCYVQIFRSLCNATRRQRRKSLRLIISLVSVFVICWAPYNCFQLADSLQKLRVVAGGCDFNQVLDIGILITESVGLSHCALNPLLYGFVGVKFRRELLKMCKEMLGQKGWVGIERLKNRRSRKSTGSLTSAESEQTSYSVMI